MNENHRTKSKIRISPKKVFILFLHSFFPVHWRVSPQNPPLYIENTKINNIANIKTFQNYCPVSLFRLQRVFLFIFIQIKGDLSSRFMIWFLIACLTRIPFSRDISFFYSLFVYQFSPEKGKNFLDCTANWKVNIRNILFCGYSVWERA